MFLSTKLYSHTIPFPQAAFAAIGLIHMDKIPWVTDNLNHTHMMQKTAWAIAIRHRGTTAWATHKRLHRGGACNVSLTYLEVMQGEAALGLIVAHQVVRTMQSTASQTRGGATTSGDKRERDRPERWTENKICILSWAIKLHDVYSYKHCDVTVCLEAGPCIRRKRQAWYTRGRSYIRHLIP